MLQDIAPEAFGHLEMVGKLIARHTSEIDQAAAHEAPIFKLRGGRAHFLESGPVRQLCVVHRVAQAGLGLPLPHAAPVEPGKSL